jgi:hypothetical protein
MRELLSAKPAPADRRLHTVTVDEVRITKDKISLCVDWGDAQKTILQFDKSTCLNIRVLSEIAGLKVDMIIVGKGKDSIIETIKFRGDFLYSSHSGSPCRMMRVQPLEKSMLFPQPV